MNNKRYEWQFDGIVGPSHHFGGLSHGNLAAMHHRGACAYPRRAAQQGLAKMQLVASLNHRQGWFPPQPRPNWALLHQLGFRGSAAHILNQARRADPQILSWAYSSSMMWAANKAVVIPSCDSDDQSLHVFPANLAYQIHRSLESQASYQQLQHLFQHVKHATVHPPLTNHILCGDEGAANHTRLSDDDHILHVFVNGNNSTSNRFPARQSLRSGQAIARSSGLKSSDVLMLQQTPAAIDAGVFHNDVIATGWRQWYWYHEAAYTNPIDWPSFVHPVVVTERQLPLADVVKSYLFNSQLIEDLQQQLHWIAPTEVWENPKALACLMSWQQDSPIHHIHGIDLRQSMHNGGGPACMRLRLPLSLEEEKCLAQSAIYNQPTADELQSIFQHHYPEQLTLDDLADPQLAEHCQAATDAISRLIQI